ncbi:hypothetical protein ACFVMC_14980 [Nocardia sp. NPDC127579]|uniref:hypothetical protein n=1 Tax=Nocardia sp. NPDC127579 TaxID=3345402 RepID=UPI0036312EE2
MTNSALAERNRRLIQHAEFAAGNTDVLHSVVHEDFIEHSPGNPSGKAAFIEYISAARSRPPGSSPTRNMLSCTTG